ncbi:MAG TPA: chemotaxis protein CheW [Polyangiales bacterium]|nr:chemotaxis protein CheW [Polyangiales bacterium]
MRAKETLCTFDLDTLFIGIEVSRIQEILRAQPVTPVPLAASVIRGLMSLRGQIVPVLDLRQRLGVSPADPNKEQFNVLIRTHDGPISLLVDNVGDVIEIEAGAFEPAPDTLNAAYRSLIRGAYKLEKRLLLALDPSSAVAVDF